MQMQILELAICKPGIKSISKIEVFNSFYI